MSTSKAELRSGVRTQAQTASATLWLWLLLAAGFLLRLLFMGNEGFRNDVSSFEAWAITLATHPFWQFYASTSFADYPPGYFYILGFIGHLYSFLAPHGNLDVLKYLVKLPAVLMDLADAALLYAIVRRFASERWALGVAALFVLNPAIIFISAAWGQVDSISSGLALLGIYLLLRSDDAPSMPRGRSIPHVDIIVAWIVLAYSLLIKPQAAILIPLFIVFAFVSPERRRVRLIASGAGILAAIIFTYALTVPFHPSNPVDAFSWLYQKYDFGKNVYAYNSVNAFNLWSIIHPFWTPDSQQIGPWPQYFWGILLVAAAAVLTLVRYFQGRTQQALIESAALLTLAFYMFSTRMHERYIYDGLIFTMASIPFARRYFWAAIGFSITLFVNLWYSLIYLSVVTNHPTGVNAADMWPAVTHPLSLLNVAVFFYLGYVFLGSGEETAARPQDAAAAQAAPLPFELKARAWFNPREGLGSMIWPLDYLLAGLLGIVSFVLSYINYWNPPGAPRMVFPEAPGATGPGIFDEIYFARAAEEYIHHQYIYENTHPPLTKLIITLSTMLLGDTPYGWRFMDVLFGAIAVVVLYAFAKRLTRSTLFSAFAALMLVADGMHFVQSRIATPEGIVVVFSLGTLYAFYRYWIASQSTARRFEPQTLRRAVLSAGGAILLGFVSGAIANAVSGGNAASLIVASVYFASGWYLVMRLWVVPRIFAPQGEFISYAEGSHQVRVQGQGTLETPDGRQVKKDLAVKEEEAAISYRRDGSVLYATPEGSATYTPGLISDDRGEIEEGRHATGWLVAFTLLLGALVASKWYGVMAYGVSFIVIAAVWLQRYWREGKAKRWGNPFGFRLDLSIAAIVFLSMSLYVCVWIPDFFRHIEIKNLGDLVYRQYTMFEYHDTLKATHPYAASWWQWPLDLRPIAYYWKDLRNGININNSNACCVAEIVSLPNPLILWFGLVTVPCIAFLAWREKNKGFALLVIAYLLQWLPWARSPRITFAYHFYVDIPLIILCNVIILQRIWNRETEQPEGQLFARIGVCAYVAAVVLAFVWFYPILAGVPIPWNEWWARMWLKSQWV